MTNMIHNIVNAEIRKYVRNKTDVASLLRPFYISQAKCECG